MIRDNTQGYDDTIKEEIKERIDITQVIGRYVKLKPAGQNLKGLCPFHKEKTPSFMVSPSKGVFHCFGCGKGGDIFTFLMEMEGINFSEALHKMADETGVTITRNKKNKKHGGMLQDAFDELEYFKAKYSELKELSDVFFAIDATKRKISKR